MLRLMMWNSLLLLLGTCSRFAIKNKILKLKKIILITIITIIIIETVIKIAITMMIKMKIKEKANQGISLMVI